ncbi:hypothetical protein [Leptothoe spongobia]|uniref:Uncharacterized protein n=1 Tax=Leptothoe spongobia TAU-MAC 1115 TaxID=1967444 RepID=A0A947GIA1_9CYAN|nr:hypothetical protein [Leptothoe spongobia]MBT9315118.1 hypothetical protein [Leptothoe spongobia TAU-MAC 1115]
MELTDFPAVQSLPTVLPKPRFQLGESVRWAVVTEPDFGQIVGIFYTEGDHNQVSGIYYLVLLDAQSPSHGICTQDMALEVDLEQWHPA